MTSKCHHEYQGRPVRWIETVRDDPSGDSGDIIIVEFTDAAGGTAQVNEFDLTTVADSPVIDKDELSRLIRDNRIRYAGRESIHMTSPAVSARVRIDDGDVDKASEVFATAGFVVVETIPHNYGTTLVLERR